MKVNVNIYRFSTTFDKEYAFLLDNHDNVAGADEAVDAFHVLFKNDCFQNFVHDFMNFRGIKTFELRHEAAFMFALDGMGCL